MSANFPQLGNYSLFNKKKQPTTENGDQLLLSYCPRPQDI